MSSQKKAYFKITIPGFKNLDADIQTAIRNGVPKAKLFIFTNMNEEWNEELEYYVRTSENECEIQWPNDEDPNTYYYIRINDDQSLRHEDKYIFDEIIPCNLTVCNTKLYLQSKSSIDESDRVAICDVVVKTIIDSKVNVSSNLEILPVTEDSYDGYSKCNAYGVTLNKPGINVDADFVLEDETVQIDANELAKNGYLSFDSYVNDSDDFSHYEFNILGAPDEMYIEYWNTLESGYQDIVVEIIKGKGGDDPLSPNLTTPLAYNVYKKIPNSKYTFNANTNHIVITDNDLLNEINNNYSYRDVNYIYNAEENPRLKKVTGKLSFKQSSVQTSSREYIESLDIRNTYVFVTTDREYHDSNYENSWDYIYDVYGLKTYINNKPVVIAAIKSYNEDQSIYVSGDQIASNEANWYDIVNEHGDLDNGEDDIVTAYVLNEEIEYEEDPTVITLYLPLNTDGSSSYASLPMQSYVTCDSKPTFSYMYTLYTDPERTHIFQIDPSLNYHLAEVSTYGVATKVEPDDYSYRAHIEDMPDTVPSSAYGHTVSLYGLQSNSKLLLGICAPGYNWKTGTKVFNYITEPKENYNPNEIIISETTLYFSSSAVVQPNVTSLYSSRVNTNYITRAYTLPSLVKQFAKHDYYSYDYEVGYYNESNEWVKLPGSIAELPESTSDDATVAYILLDFGDIWLCSNSTNEMSPPRTSIILRARKKTQPHYALYKSAGGLLYSSDTLSAGGWTSLIPYPGTYDMPSVPWGCSDESLPQISIVKVLDSIGAEVNFDISIKNTSENLVAITNNDDQRSPEFRTVIFTLSKQSYMGCTALISDNSYSNSIYNEHLYPGHVYELVNIDYSDMIYEEGATYRVLNMFKASRGCIGEPLITDWNDMQYFSICNVNGKIALSVSNDLTTSYLPYVSYVWFYKV